MTAHPGPMTLSGDRGGIRYQRLSLMGTVAAAALCVQPALAQTTTPSAGNTDSQTVTEIVVTGSHVARAGFKSPTPLTVVGKADLFRVAAPNIADVLNQLPQLKPSLTTSSATNLSTVAGGNFMDLRGLAYLRTLTLIDGKRYVPSSTTGAVNVNLIPQALIGGADVVTGGASAAYGSDAVAGVVNLKLDQSFDGVRATAQGGVSDKGDDRNYLVSLAFGTKFADDRGHVIAGFETADNKGVPRMSDRDWGKNAGVIANPNYTSSNGQPLYLLVNDARYSNASYGGVINSPGILKGIQFGSGGTTSNFTYGNSVSSTQMDGGDGVAVSGDNVLEAPLQRSSGYVGGTFKLSDHATLYGNLAYGRSAYTEDAITGIDQITIKADNAYLPDSVKSLMTQNNISSFVMGRSLNDYGRGKLGATIKTWQAVAGVKGDLVDTWTYDVSYAYGKTRNLTLFSGNRITARFNQSVDAVVNPVTGDTVCRSTLTDPSNGCLPINLFGTGSVSQAAVDWMTGTSVRDWHIDQEVADAVVRGTPWATWAGPVSLAFGGEWRKQSVKVTSDALSMQSAFRSGNTQPYKGEVSVSEGFVESVIPLAQDQRWAKSIDMNLAARVTNYSTSGSVTTWKAGINYAVNDSLRFRASRSRDIRAPSINELFAGGATLVYTITDPQLGQTYTIQGISGGNPNLKPEKADSWTVGAIFTPSFLHRFNLSVDYYNIDLKDAINTLTAQTIISRCYTDTPQVCSLITRENGTITKVALSPANFQAVQESGVDIEAAFKIPLGHGALDLRALVNYTEKLDLIDGATTTNYAGDTEQPSLDGIGGVPHWRYNASASYGNDDYRVSLTNRYVGGGVISRTYSYLNGASVTGRFYWDLSGEKTLTHTSIGKLVLFGAVQNLFDKDPPITGISGYGTTRSLYDTIGRVYRAGVRVGF